MQDGKQPGGSKTPRPYMLSPQNEDQDGPKYDPVSQGEVPKDPCGFFSQGTKEKE
jgi:hypothetical protein